MNDFVLPEKWCVEGICKPNLSRLHSHAPILFDKIKSVFPKTSADIGFFIGFFYYKDGGVLQIECIIPIDYTLITFEQFEKYVLNIKNMELKVTKERVLAAANKCNQAKEVLKEMFPEVFEDDKYLEINEAVFKDRGIMLHGLQLMETRRGSYTKFNNKGFWLNSNFKWEILEDECGVSCLVPTKKQ